MLSCAFHSLCPGIPNESSVFCPYHHIVAARLLLWSRGTARIAARRRRRFTTRLGLTAETVQPHINFVEPSEGNILNTVRYVNDLYSRKDVWIIDVEIHQPRNHLPVPFAIAIYDAKTSEPILRTDVDHDSALPKDIEEIFLQNIPSGLQPWGRVGCPNGTKTLGSRVCHLQRSDTTYDQLATHLIHIVS